MHATSVQSVQGFILGPDGFIAGRLVAGADGRVVLLEGQAVPEAQARSGSGPIILPGYIDLHVHGGGGFDVMQGGEAALEMARLHVRHGTTALLATTMTAPPEDIDAAFDGLTRYFNGAPLPPGAARLLGVHLEGPYISAERLGAQPDFVQPVALEQIRRWHALAPVRLLTLAPEVEANLALIPALVAMGIRVQLGHTSGSYEQGCAALAQGATGFTHLFNAMSPLHHRNPGMVGAALAHAEYAEVIPDLLHVHPGAIQAALRAIPRLYCVTDSTAAAAMPDGDYQLGRHTVHKCLGGVRLADGTLAGSVLTMDQALRNLVQQVGLSLQDASRRVSTCAADHLRLSDRGRLTPGAWADWVVLDAELQVREVVVEGRLAHIAEDAAGTRSYA
jgi:N-acetylglucosamine-6-phosphate deacetylase